MRRQKRKTGAVTVTELELRRYDGLGDSYRESPAGRVRQYKYDSTDYAADTRDGESVYRIDVEHNMETQAYVWNLYKDENSTGVNLFDYAQERNTLRLWFYGNTLDITVNIAF